jgi:hypothetical protein
MNLRRIWLLSLTLLALALSWSQQAAAQTSQRWLADTELIGPVKSIGPTNVVAGGNGIYEMKLLDSTLGWAVSYRGVLRFDGRFWRPEIYSGPGSLTAIDATGATNAWAVGFDYYTGPPTVGIAHYDGTRWSSISEFVRKDGSRGPIAGGLTDVVAHAGASGSGTAWAIGNAYEQNQAGFYDRQRPLVLFFDGTTWRDHTPDAWREGELTRLSMISPNEGWATGQLGPANDRRPVILHLKDGVWTEETLPQGAQPFQAREIIMVNANEGWATLATLPTEQQPCATGRLLRYAHGTWTLTPGEAHTFQPVVLGLLPGTNRGWASLLGCDAAEKGPAGRRMRFDNGIFTPDSGGTPIVPTTYALLHDYVQWAAGDGRPMRYTAEPIPTDPIWGSPSGGRYFPETGHTISGLFKQYYETHGLELGDRGISARESLALFGYPLSAPFSDLNPDTGEPLITQYFERARMEYHPDNPNPYKVLLGRLGASSLIAREGVLFRPTGSNVPPTPPTCQNFGETGYDLCPPLRGFWQRNGGLAVYGYPINAARDETSRTDHKTYLTQWFERERLEYHPELRGTPYEVLLGLLGAEELRVRGYIQ